MKEGESHSFEFRIQQKNQRWIILKTTGIVINEIDNTVQYITFFNEDKTSEKEYENEKNLLLLSNNDVEELLEFGC
ncbi:MAG: hypothetical protein JWQ96_3093 [Segetibacter sp.]|nr:hypothetical protein [Segetibacter sp.]